MEVIAKKKIELQRIREEKAVFEEMERKKKLEETVLNEILEKKQNDNSQLLQRALRRGE